ncbi:MAG: thiopeptide-type bacteriocin biosynthesis protein [Pseudomonadota bacterium]
METPLTDASHDPWVYVKLYLGRAVDRMDRLLIDLASQPVLTGQAQQWFYIRYVDQDGIHVRLRAKARPGEREALARAVMDACADLLAELPGYPPGDYSPMVTMPGFEASLERVTAAHHDVKVVQDRYEPETDKYGARPGIDVAEALFHQSSLIATRILREEEHGRLSRKDLVPLLMHEACETFIAPDDRASFWREYSYYWLNGRSPAADDWRATFAEKAQELQQRGIAVVARPERLDGAARELSAAWRRALREAAAGYQALKGRVDAGAEVLCFNFVHLMNNRLGLAALEEAYMAALLERECERAGQREAVAELA